MLPLRSQQRGKSLHLALLLLLLYLQRHILDLVEARQDAGVDGVGNLLTGLRHQLRQLLHVGERMLKRALGEFGRQSLSLQF